jgi:hypothetical protein
VIEPVHDWWTLLRGVAALNLMAWALAAAWCWRQRRDWPPHVRLDRRWQLLLSAGYVVGCAWRSLLPVYDVPRLVLVDSFWSSVLVGRSVATAAELCFAAQWALLLRATARETGAAWGEQAARAVLPLIVLAEGFSWYSVLSTSNLGHTVEESLWGLCALLVAVGLLQALPRLARPQRHWLALWSASALLYAGYMIGVDVPMYWQRWLEQLQAGHAPLGLLDGLADIASRWTVSHDWSHWRSEVVWMTAYFSLGVWSSIALTFAPVWRRVATPLPCVPGRSTVPRLPRSVLRRRPSINS